MTNAFRITTKIDLPREIRREAQKMNIYSGQIFTNRERAEKLIERTLNNPERYEVCQVYGSKITL